MSEAAMQQDTIQYDGPDDEPLEAVNESEAPEAEADEAAVAEASDETEAQLEERKPVVPEFTPEQQAYINEHIVARQRARAGQFEERAQQLEQELERLRSQQQQPVAASPDGAPEVPPLPDIWEPDYEQKLAARDEAIAKRKEWEIEQRYQKQQQEWEQQQQIQQQMQALQGRVQSYSERAEKLGVNAQQLAAAGNFLAQVGLPDGVTEYVLDEEHGPLITMHLAQNTADLQALSQLSPIKAAVYIDRQIKPKVARAIQRKASAPEPTETLKGSGAPPKQRGPQGAVYE